jgi:hypothetical protein
LASILCWAVGKLGDAMEKLTKFKILLLNFAVKIAIIGSTLMRKMETPFFMGFLKSTTF